ncbi:hypothetical protein OG474_22730 [Kribbella sp. NBC_01505]|uniref:hypothetical protein n=1 Tax=Kribbella sp. NBC_01505 TaxID=2903580 RepID=UPI003867FEE4
MRERLVSLPTWVLFLCSTLLCLLPMLVTTLFDSSHLEVKVLFYVGFSLVFGAMLTFALRRRFRSERRAVGDIPVGVESAAHRALGRGQVPTDPEVRAATLRLAEHQLGMMIKCRPLVIIGFTLAMVSTVVGVVGGSGSPWRLLFVAGYLPLMLAQWYGPKKMRRRIQELSEPAESS